MTPLSVLFVAHISPPSAMSAARRTAGLARHLPDAGVKLTVLTSIASGPGPVPGAAATIRTRDLLVSPLNWRRASFQALSGESGGAYETTPSALAAVIVPDLELVGWVPFALPRALSLAARRRFDCVITSAPPFSGHLVGLALAARGIPWIADFRDGWTFETGRPAYPGRAQHGLDVWLERRVVGRADAVVGVTAPITDDLVARFGVRGETITNGYDPTEQQLKSNGWSPPLRPDRHSLVYTGSLAYGGTSPEVLIASVRALREQRPELADRLEVVVAGAMGSGERAALTDPALGDSVRVLGNLPRHRALMLQSAADSLLVLAGDRRSSVATGKLYEYLAARKPIVVLGDGTVAAQIVREQSAGVVAPARDAAAMAGVLAQLAEGRLTSPGTDPARYAYPALAARYAALIQEVVQRRAR
jgi:glycosyltransferase involved in cell wall biosynthesis